ncbi:MAG: DUF4395 domain-containing protein [Pseudonocardiales bacterium]|nr:DUF4395 domain-containing protein [Pseudonocardiales bacterium]
MSNEPGLDPRGPRFAATITAIVAAVVLITGSGWLLAAQAVVFAIGGFIGIRYAPYSVLYRRLVAPRLAPPTEREPAAPVQFSQALGFGFAAVGAVGYLTGFTTVGIVAAALAFAAAFLNAAFDFCMGCEVYGLIIRFTKRGTTTRQGATA